MAEIGYKLKLLEAEHGDLSKVIPRLVNALGQQETAKRLGCSQFTISNWLKDNGYVRRTEWVKDRELEAAS